MKQYWALIKTLWVMEVWEPFLKLWNELVGYSFCCDKPDWEWQEVPEFSIRRCKSCGDSHTYPRNP